MDVIFPDEIFLQIFRYLNRLNLFRGFYNLNSRINRIIGGIRMDLRSCLTNDERQYILPNLHPKQIRTFHVCEELYQYPNLNECINIRELTFDWRSQYNVFMIRHPQLVVVQPKNFPHLRSLTIRQQSWKSEYVELCTMLFGNQFPVLKYLFLPYANGSCIRGIKTWSTSLTEVTVEVCNRSMLYPLLDNLPNLETFSCTPGTTDSGWELKSQCSALKRFDLLTYDQFESHPMTMMSTCDIEGLFRCFPNLETTILVLHCIPTLDNGFRALHAILSQCPKLKTVSCDMKYSKPDCSQQSLDAMKNRYPFFKDYKVDAWEEGNGYRCNINTR